MSHDKNKMFSNELCMRSLSVRYNENPVHPTSLYEKDFLHILDNFQLVLTKKKMLLHNVEGDQHRELTMKNSKNKLQTKLYRFEFVQHFAGELLAKHFY